MKNKKVLIYFFYIAISFTLGGIYFLKIYSPDGFSMLYYGVDYYNDVCTYQNLRPIEFFINKIFLLIFEKSVEYIILYRIYLVISLIIIATSMYLVYLNITNIIVKKNGYTISNNKKMLITLSVILIFFNKFIADNLIFLENIVMMLGLFFAVIASIVYSSNNKYKFIITFLLLILSEFCYQTMITVFVILSMLFYIIENKDKKISIRYILNLTTLFLIPLLILLFTSFIMKYCGININTRLWNVNQTIIINIICTVYFYLLIYFLYFAISALYIKKEDIAINKNLVYNIFIMTMIGCIYTLSFLITNSARISCRMAFAMGALPGCLLIILAVYSNFKSKKSKVIYLSFMSVFFIIEIVGGILIYNTYVEYNKKICNNCETIVSYIENYNNTHDEKVNKIAIYSDSNITISNWYSIIPHLDFEIYNIEENFYCRIKGIYDNLNLEYKEANVDIYNQYFKGKDWNEFDTEEFIVIEDTLHFCKY